MRNATRPWRHVLQNGCAEQRMDKLERPRGGQSLRRREPIRGQLRNRVVELGEPGREHHLSAAPSTATARASQIPSRHPFAPRPSRLRVSYPTFSVNGTILQII